MSTPPGIEGEGNLSPLAPNEAYLGPDRLILDGLSAYVRQLKDLEFGNDTWWEAPHKKPLLLQLLLVISHKKNTEMQKYDILNYLISIKYYR